tara:strand:- start:373 stop:1347 length:975 start_codon:yes stop_codon:yes gene_type:complete
MKHIVIIGCGSIGIRHLESLLKIRKKVKISVIDKSNSSLFKAKLLIKKFDKNINNVEFFNKIKKFEKTIDLAIISTNSDIRKKIFDKLLKYNSIKNIILEKIVFQKIKDFNEVEKNLKNRNIKCFVNFPRREMFDYIKLKKLLLKEKRINITVNGSNWGLASNSIHMLDLLSFLRNSKRIYLLSNNLHNKIYKSYRKNFREFKGSLLFENEYKDTVYLNDSPSELKKNRGGIMIESDNISLKIFEFKKLISILNTKKSLTSSIEKFNTIYQSSLTSIYVNKIFGKKKLNLPTLKESKKEHIVILNLFNRHIKKLKKKFKYCQIT